ncbi:hypothetical protein DRP43_00300 [candidate division TA06 bacterium]|uniref:DUF401 family protein n=1 Tax=candidate division TA06 bacterium TaxID=2250710 RepID=A0A660SQ60_UNCT6|nr:MAG: hypothetical protein DRP43_00300 [candidate division TA06 bacterium]
MNILIIIKIITVFIILIMLMRFKAKIGIAFLITTVSFILMFFYGWANIGRTIFKALSSWETWRLVLSVYFILILSNIMEITGNTKALVNSIIHSLKNKRLAAIFLPAFIGLIPMPGGALFSAPMVKNVINAKKAKPAILTYFNYWNRHIWEFFWPLYPGIILISSIFNIKIFDITVHLWIFTPLMVFVGYIYTRNLTFIDYKIIKGKYLKSFLKSSWYIFFIIITLLIFKIDIVIVLASVLIIDMIIYRKVREKFIKIAKKSFNINTIVLLFSIMLFKTAINDSGFMGYIGDITKLSLISQYSVITLLPFIMGILTGITVGFVGIALPLLSSIIGTGDNIKYSLLALTFIAGFSGVLLSPFHLCLILTKEYYKANFKDIYKILLPSVITLFIASLCIIIIIGRLF